MDYLKGSDTISEKEKEAILQNEANLIVDYPKVELLPTTHVVQHDLMEHEINQMRNVTTNATEFRAITARVTERLLNEATRNLKMKEYVVVTPICSMIGRKIDGKKPALVPIMRAGNEMESATKRVIPVSRTGHIGLFRDEETLEPQAYFCKLPEAIERREAYLLDPMLATGGSANAAINMLKKAGCSNIKFICIIAAPQGVDLLQKNHPDVELYIGHLDKGLNKNGYIVPGLGDAGDRIYGTK